MPLQSVNRTADVNDILTVLRRDGVVVIPELIDRADMQRLVGKIEPKTRPA